MESSLVRWVLAEQGTSKHSQAQYNYTNTNTQIYKYTNIQIHRYKCSNMFDMLGVIPTPQWSLCTQTVPSPTISIWCPSLQVLFTRTKAIRGTRVMMPLSQCDFFLRRKILICDIEGALLAPRTLVDRPTQLICIYETNIKDIAG